VKPDVVLFDIDGTLLDSVDAHAQAWVEAFTQFGYAVSFETVRPQIGKGGDQIIPTYVPPEMIKKIGQDLEAYRADLFKRVYLPRVRPFPRVRDLCVTIRQHGQRVALASSGKKDEVAEYKRIARIADVVDMETSADDAKRSKPAPDIFEAALVKLSPLPPSRIVVVGDTTYDAIAAGKVGLKTVGLLCGGTPLQALRAAGCIAIYKSPADLLAKFEDSPLADVDRYEKTA
jgi:phosphoglycolate phosphatase-like HAD superfamily hydrolase